MLPHITHSFQGRYNFGNPDAEIFVNDYDFSLCYEFMINEYVYRFARELVQLDNGALPHVQDFFNEFFGTAQFYGHLHENVHDKTDVSRFLGCRMRH